MSGRLYQWPATGVCAASWLELRIRCLCPPTHLGPDAGTLCPPPLRQATMCPTSPCACLSTTRRQWRLSALTFVASYWVSGPLGWLGWLGRSEPPARDSATILPCCLPLCTPAIGATCLASAQPACRRRCLPPAPACAAGGCAAHPGCSTFQSAASIGSNTRATPFPEDHLSTSLVGRQPQHRPSVRQRRCVKQSQCRERRGSTTRWGVCFLPCVRSNVSNNTGLLSALASALPR